MVYEAKEERNKPMGAGDTHVRVSEEKTKHEEAWVWLKSK